MRLSNIAGRAPLLAVALALAVLAAPTCAEDFSPAAPGNCNGYQQSGGGWWYFVHTTGWVFSPDSLELVTSEVLVAGEWEMAGTQNTGFSNNAFNFCASLQDRESESGTYSVRRRAYVRDDEHQSHEVENSPNIADWTP